MAEKEIKMNRKQKQQQQKTQHNLYIQKKKSQKIHKDYWYNGKWR